MEVSKYKIRYATEKDLHCIQQLNQKLFEKEVVDYDELLKTSWSFGDGEKYFQDALKNGCVVVALFGDDIVGYLSGSFANHSYYNECYAELDNMFVEVDHRKCGVGTMLVEEFIRCCDERGIKIVKVTAYADNCDAINFYRKNGFVDFELTLRKELK